MYYIYTTYIHIYTHTYTYVQAELPLERHAARKRQGRGGVG